MNMDLDDLLEDDTKHGKIRSSRFAPKGSKFQPKPIFKPKTEPKKEEVDEKPEEQKEAVDMDVEKLKLEDNSIKTEAPDVEDALGDEVVSEIEVYFDPCVDLETQLYMFQYVHRPAWRPYELDDRCEEVRLNPTSAEVEIDLAIDLESKNYDAGTDPRLQMKKQTLTTLWKPPQTSCCTVGVRTGNELHLTPIHSFVQLRTSMRHLDAKESKKKTAEVKSEELKPSKVSKIQKAPVQIDNSGEDWIPLKYHSVRSDLAEGYLKKMQAQKGSDIYFSTSGYDYLDSLCPGIPTGQTSKVPLRSLLELPLKERFQKWLVEGPPLQRFNTLKHLAPNERDEQVLAVLQELGLVVQGLWVPRTSLVYEETQGVRVLARNYVAVLFSKDAIIKNSQIPKKRDLAEEMKRVLRGLAKERPTLDDWKLKEAPDSDFVKHHHDVVKKQREELDRTEKGISKLLSSMKTNSHLKRGRVSID